MNVVFIFQYLSIIDYALKLIIQKTIDNAFFQYPIIVNKAIINSLFVQYKALFVEFLMISFDNDKIVNIIDDKPAKNPSIIDNR